ncbi:MAG TPA: hypothetical protein DER56_02165 [Thermosipho africanus]|nr:hypothetical protein [Thermosipho africanus]
MKFKSIEITNFMRYKGCNTIKFSCDRNMNVTVVLGNNTFGKTTIAQAFRWVLYGEIINTRYVKSKDVILLNNEVLAEMDANSEENVQVRLEVEDGEYTYEFIRRAVFTRKFPQLVVKQNYEKLLMRYKTDVWSDYIDDNGDKNGKNRGQVSDMIQMMFPQELSSYFLFDGERWGEEKNSKSDIKDSISTIMGISPLVQMKIHLNEYGTYGRNGVIKKLQSKIVGSGNESEVIKNRKDQLFEDINRCEELIQTNKRAASDYLKKIEESQELLDSNPKIEEEQERYKRFEIEIPKNEKRIEEYYADIVKEFSRSYTYFSTPLLESIIKMLQEVDLEGKDIPGIEGATIDYLIEYGECICGHKIIEGSLEHENLLALKKVVPPERIGAIVGRFQDDLEQWTADGQDIVSEIYEKAESLEGEKAILDENKDEKERLEKKIDGKINFSLERKKMIANKSNRNNALEIIRKNENNITDIQRKIESLDSQLKDLSVKNELNAKVYELITYAEALYETTKDLLKKKEAPLLNELNELIRNNYEIMFQEKEKYAQLEDDYTLHIFYKSIGVGQGYKDFEEHALSEGELIARNFIFIVSILELAKRKKLEEFAEGEVSGVLNLPLVLDGPFSKLSTENTGLVAKVLPDAAEQVIVFMLDKDWEASGLGKNTKSEYMFSIFKEKDSKSAKLVPFEGAIL